MFARSLLASVSIAMAACTASSNVVDSPVTSIDPEDQLAFSNSCKDWDEWEKPAPPFRIYGGAYYVGTCGIASILITREDGHALIDTGTEKGADLVLANIHALGFDPKDIKLLLASHEHFDHVGGMAKIQEATGAVVVSSEIAVDVMVSGLAHKDDPQFGMHDPMMPIGAAMPWHWGDAPYLVDYFGISPVQTPGHTPGAMSWQWQECEDEDCRWLLYADSLSPVSSDEYRFSDHPEYVAAYRAGLDRLSKAECNILLTPHPSASEMLERLQAEHGLYLHQGCAWYSESIGNRLDARLEKEAAQ